MTDSSYHHGALRSALLDAALAMVEEGKDLTLRGVARRAGVSHAAPYHHFADRRALVAGLAEEGLARLRESLAAAALEHETDPGRSVLEIGVAYVRFALANPSLFRLIFSPELADREGLPALEAAYAETWRGVKEMAHGVLGEDSEPETVTLWGLRGWSMVHGLANLILDRQVPGISSPEEGERIARRMLIAGAARRQPR